MSVMNQQLKDQYDSLYASKKDFYGVEPVSAVRDLCEYIFTGSVLDIGGGEGRNALYLAEKGFTVTVYDLSKIGIQKLQLAAKEKHLTIQTKVTDILSDRLERDFDVLIRLCYIIWPSGMLKESLKKHRNTQVIVVCMC